VSWLVGSIIESLVLRIELTDDALIATDLRGRRRYDIATIDRIEEAKGDLPAMTASMDILSSRARIASWAAVIERIDVPTTRPVTVPCAPNVKANRGSYAG
jgi:hypothetical protein